jgi:hypothetical protein
MSTIYLDKSQVPAQLRGDYAGTKFQVEVRENVHIPADAGLWSGGSRSHYYALRVADGAGMPFPGQAAAPWDCSRQGRDVALVPGMAVVCHRIFAGKDMGLRFYLHPADAAPMLPAPADALSPVAQLVLDYTAGRKSSYAGQDRYAMAVSDLKSGYRSRDGIARLDRALWDEAKAQLVSMGLLNRAGAITPAGRNRAGRV